MSILLYLLIVRREMYMLLSTRMSIIEPVFSDNTKILKYKIQNLTFKQFVVAIVP